MNPLIILGADIEIIELIEDIGGFLITGIVDKHLSGKYYNYNIIGDDDFFLKHKDKYLSAGLVLTLDDVIIKEKLYDKYKASGFSFPQIISKKSFISKYADIKEGVIIQNGVNIGAGVSIGKVSKINVNANVMHDGVIGSFNTIAPNAITLGYSETGSNVFLGANAVLLPRCKVSSNVIIGSGAVVTKNLESGWVYTGCPATKYKMIK